MESGLVVFGPNILYDNQEGHLVIERMCIFVSMLHINQISMTFAFWKCLIPNHQNSKFTGIETFNVMGHVLLFNLA